MCEVFFNHIWIDHLQCNAPSKNAGIEHEKRPTGASRLEQERANTIERYRTYLGSQKHRCIKYRCTNGHILILEDVSRNFCRLLSATEEHNTFLTFHTAVYVRHLMGQKSLFFN